MGKWAAFLALVPLRIFFDVLFGYVVESFYRKADSLTIGSFSLTNRGKLSRTHAAGVPFLWKNRPFAVILRGHLPELQIESNAGITSHDVIKRIYELKPYNVITRNGYPFGQRDFTIYIYIYINATPDYYLCCILKETLVQQIFVLTFLRYFSLRWKILGWAI